jgi:hypothetical protein
MKSSSLRWMRLRCPASAAAFAGVRLIASG